jgi:formylglycine-generating enzyme required for sulfatase activity
MSTLRNTTMVTAVAMSGSDHPLADGIPPEWADEWGQDRHGGWCSFRVGDATQRMRWIPPGRFRMGSLDHDKERFDWEGPQREVAIETGFWIFETPCTQALWQTVMGNNPSRFQAPDRPVESVSWNDAKDFIRGLRKRLRELALDLPSEAQWEYACRAGSKTARYRDDLDAIAWYAGNSEGSTHPVREKEPNEWGLYDTLGNVWEWCQDPWSAIARGPEANAAAIIASAHRVVRGGSWYGVARDVRAAYRNPGAPSYRVADLGFRCAEFRKGRELEPARN